MANVSELVAQLIEQIILREEAFKGGDVELSNKANDAAVKVEDKIRLATNGDMQALKPLLTHENAEVRVWVATELLPDYEEETKGVLQQVRDGNLGLIGFTAKIVLQEWDKGNWNGKPYTKGR